MVSEGNKRYLRYILLLGEGTLLTLRGIIRREVIRTGQTLEGILSTPNIRQKLETKCNSQHRLRLFPSYSTVNADTDSWDIFLLIFVLRELFWSKLSTDERTTIDYLRLCRNEFQGHPPTMLMDEADFTTRSDDLRKTLHNLASGIDKETQNELTIIINDSASVQFDFHAAVQNLQRLYEFKEDVLKEFQHVNAKLHKMDEHIQDVTNIMGDVATIQYHMHDDILDVKTLARQNNSIAQASSDCIEALKAKVSEPRELTESDRERIKYIETKVSEPRELSDSDGKCLKNIEKMLEMFLQQKDPSKIQQDVDTKMNVNSDTPENTAEAQGTIITSVNDLLRQIRPSILEDNENIDIIRERVNELLRRDEGHTCEFTKALLELINDIIQHGIIQGVRKGSILLNIRFSSYDDLLNYIHYLKSQDFQLRLSNIACALKDLKGHPVTLSAQIAEESFSALHRHLAEECEKRSRTIVLPIRCKGIEDTNHIWKLLQRGGADKHMEKISAALSKIVGGKTIVTTSVDLKQFEQALLNTVKEQCVVEKKSQESLPGKETLTRTGKSDKEQCLAERKWQESSSAKEETLKRTGKSFKRKEPFPKAVFKQSDVQSYGKSSDDIRILLVGGAGHGKSSTGNSIIAENTFKVSTSGKPVSKTAKWSGKCRRFGKVVEVVDTPGNFATDSDHSIINIELLEALALCAPGFHVIAFVLMRGRFTEEIQKTQDLLFQWFGPDVEKFACVILTDTNSEDETNSYIYDNPPEKLSELVRSCSNNVVPLNNVASADIKFRQIIRFFEVVENIKQKNNNRHFSTVVFQLAAESGDYSEKMQADDDQSEKLIQHVKHNRTFCNCTLQ